MEHTETAQFVTYTFEYTTMEILDNQFHDELARFGVDTPDNSLPSGRYVLIDGRPRLVERYRDRHLAERPEVNV